MKGIVRKDSPFFVSTLNLLVLAATNSPWDLDDALMRPGRFDRRIFVPPPDDSARLAILARLSADIPKTTLNLKKLTKATPSGTTPL